jgi:2-oxoglutarate dehydrogenase E2 component (dihydrolipoamide succinyltransferase)
MQVVQPTTASQIFHLLRRQMVRNLRKPLVIMTPKSLLRNKDATSPLSEFTKGSFQTVIPEHKEEVNKKADKVKRVIACSGKVYYDLSRSATRRRPTTWPSCASSSSTRSRTRPFAAELKKYPNATDIVWCQDEPQNQGAWFFVQHYIHENMLEGQKLGYSGRAASASPAVGYSHLHQEQQKALVDGAFGKLKGFVLTEISFRKKMAIVEVKVPQLSESVAEATLLQWKKKAGEAVAIDEILIEIETDKVVLEVPAPAAGVLAEIVVADGATVVAEQLIARIDTEGKAGAAAPRARAGRCCPPRPRRRRCGRRLQGWRGHARRRQAHGRQQPARRLVAGTGKDGRVTKGDVLGACRGRRGGRRARRPCGRIPTGVPRQAALPQVAGAAAPDLGDRPEQRVPMSRLRARVAERLLQSQSTNAILTTFNEVNMAPVMEMRKRFQEKFEKEHGVKIGFMSFFVKAAVHALKKYPVLNASVDGNDIVYHGYFDIGIAVGSPRGLVVPILRNADQMSFADIEKKIAEFGARRATASWASRR